MNRLVIGAMAASAIGVLFGSALWAQQAPHSASGGVFTADQADRGSAVYFQHCFKCHLDDLTGGAAGPPLTGVDFLSHWKGKPVADLFNMIRMTQPIDNPGSLTPGRTADVLAYILRANKYPVGDNDLQHDLSTLQQIPLDAIP